MGGMGVLGGMWEIVGHMKFREFFKTATGHEPYDYRCRLVCGDYVPVRPPSVEEADVARRNIQQVNAEFFKCGQNGLNCGPTILELLPLLCFPIGPDVVWELGARVEVGTGEVEDEWARDNGHLDYAQFVVEADELRHLESQNASDHPPGEGSIVLQVDDSERRWKVRLPEGMSKESKRVALALSE